MYERGKTKKERNSITDVIFIGAACILASLVAKTTIARAKILPRITKKKEEKKIQHRHTRRAYNSRGTVVTSLLHYMLCDTA